MRPGVRRSVAGLLLIVSGACDRTPPAPPPALEPPTLSPSASGGACPVPEVGATVVRFSSDGVCLSGTTMLLYECPGSDVPVLRLAGAHRVVNFLGGPFAVPVESVPANIRFVGRGHGHEVLVADPLDPSPSPSPSGSPDVSASVSPPGPPALQRTEPLVYVRKGGVTERWLPMARPRSVNDPPVLWLIGDSIMDGGREALERSLADWTLTLDAEAGRPSSSALELAAAAAEEEADVVVVELGTNDSSSVVFRDHLMETLGLLDETPFVLWQTVRAPETDETAAAVNEAIRDVVPRTPNVAIADWERFVPDDALMSDGIHPAEEFGSLESDLLSPILTAWRGAVAGDGATSCGARVLRATL